MDTEAKTIANHISIREGLFVFCIILFSGIIRIPSLTQPLGPDQGIMAVIGEGILQGKLPYKDYWEMGSPAIFFTYALIFKIFGVSMSAIPIVDTLVSMLTTFLVFLLARSIWGKGTGYISALLFGFFSNGVRLGMHAGGDIAFGTFWYIGQRESFMLPLIVASFYLIIKSERMSKKSWWLSLSGFLSGLSFAFKFPSLVFFACLFLYVTGSSLLTSGRKPWKSLASLNIALISGFVLSLAPFVIFFGLKGTLTAMTDIIFKFVFSVYGHLDQDYLAIIKLGLIRTYFIALENFILWIFFITSSVHILLNTRIKEHLLVVLWGMASVLFIISHREFFGYHYLVVLPPFSILAGYGIVTALGPKFRLKKIFTVEFGKAFIILALLANLSFFATLNYMHYTKFYYYLTGKISKESYYDFFNAYPKHDYSFSADYKVAQYIEKNSDANDMIYSLGGIESVIYFLTKRESPSRFIFSWIIFSETHGRVEQAEVYREEVLADLKNKIPKYIITVRPLEQFEQFCDIYGFIKNNYVLAKAFPDDRFVYAYKKHKGRNT